MHKERGASGARYALINCERHAKRGAHTALALRKRSSEGGAIHIKPMEYSVTEQTSHKKGWGGGNGEMMGHWVQQHHGWMRAKAPTSGTVDVVRSDAVVRDVAIVGATHAHHLPVPRRRQADGGVGLRNERGSMESCQQLHNNNNNNKYFKKHRQWTRK